MLLLSVGRGSVPELQGRTGRATVPRHVRVRPQVPGAGCAAGSGVRCRHELQDNAGAGRQPDTQHQTLLVE